MTDFTKRDIAEILGRPSRTIMYWTDFGIIIPDIRPSQGKGITRLYSLRNLVEFAMLDIMAQLNVSLDTSQYIFKTLRSGYFSELDSDKKWIITDFYKNSEWGNKKELAYFEHMYFSKNRRNNLRDKNVSITVGSFSIVEKDFDMNDAVGWNPDLGITDVAYESILWLGNIKKQALELHGIKYPKPKGVRF